MGKATVIPFGPQHPVLPEPLHLDLVVEDETVIEAVPQIGFIHRGLEKLVETRDYNQFIYVAERICGICAFGHSMGYAETVEKLMGVEIPERAEYLRVIWHELSRIHSHVLWMGLAADACSCTAGACASACSTSSRRPRADASFSRSSRWAAWSATSMTRSSPR